jgi:hypothetical protein
MLLFLEQNCRKEDERHVSVAKNRSDKMSAVSSLACEPGMPLTVQPAPLQEVH